MTCIASSSRRAEAASLSVSSTAHASHMTMPLEELALTSWKCRSTTTAVINVPARCQGGGGNEGRGGRRGGEGNCMIPSMDVSTPRDVCSKQPAATAQNQASPVVLGSKLQPFKGVMVVESVIESSYAMMDPTTLKPGDP